MDQRSAANFNFSITGVDEECGAKLRCARVYGSAPHGTLDAMLVRADVERGENEFVLLQLLEENEIGEKKSGKFGVWSRTGRLGFKGQGELVEWGNDFEQAFEVFSQKFFDKTGQKWADLESFRQIFGKFDLIELDHSIKCKKGTLEDALRQAEGTPKNVANRISNVLLNESRLEPQIRRVMEAICDLRAMDAQVRRMERDVARCPLDCVSQAQIRRGFEALSKIERLILREKFAREYFDALSEYYTKIPHNFGAENPPQIRTLDALCDEIALLKTLSEIQIAISTLSDAAVKKADASKVCLMNPLDKKYDSLKWTLRALAERDEMFAIIKKYLHQTHGDTHRAYRMKLKNVFELNLRDTQRKNVAEDAALRRQIGNRKLLWHGTRVSNWIGILTHGLQIAPPTAPETGCMFGKGIYLTDVSSKSANYTRPEHGQTAFVILVEAALGNAQILYTADVNAAAQMPRDGAHSVRAVGRTQPRPDGDVWM